MFEQARNTPKTPCQRCGTELPVTEMAEVLGTVWKRVCPDCLALAQREQRMLHAVRDVVTRWFGPPPTSDGFTRTQSWNEPAVSTPLADMQSVKLLAQTHSVPFDEMDESQLMAEAAAFRQARAERFARRSVDRHPD